jgi:hypothetical protein
VKRVQEAAKLVLWEDSQVSELTHAGFHALLHGKKIRLLPKENPDLYDDVVTVEQLLQNGLRLSGLGIGSGQAGERVIEVYAAPHRLFPELRSTMSAMLALDEDQVATVESKGFHADAIAGAPGGHSAVGAVGTLGGFVQAANGAQVRALSNNHIFARCNLAGIGDGLVSPNHFLLFGTLHSFVPFLPRPNVNRVDAALGDLLPNQHLQSRYAPPTGMQRATRRLRVEKYGAVTARTTGRVTSINAAVTVTIPGLGLVNFEDMIRVVGDGGVFTSPGDSGSFVRSRRSNRLVGLHVGSDGSSSVACAIRHVFASLGVEVLDVEAYPVQQVDP